MESLHRLIIHTQEALSCALLGDLQEHRDISSLLGALSPIQTVRRALTSRQLQNMRREGAEQHFYSFRSLLIPSQGFPIPLRKESSYPVHFNSICQWPQLHSRQTHALRHPSASRYKTCFHARYRPSRDCSPTLSNPHPTSFCKFQTPSLWVNSS